MSAALFLQWWQRLRVESHFLGDGLVEPRGGGLQRAALVGAAKVGGELGQDHRSEDVAQPRRAGGRAWASRTSRRCSALASSGSCPPPVFGARAATSPEARGAGPGYRLLRRQQMLTHQVTTTGPLPTMGTNCHALSLTSRAFVRLGPDLN
jgi:hypothetical protein